MTTYRARWVLPSTRPPIPDGTVTVDRGLITGVNESAPASGVVDLGDVALLPGLVNAHTHLELSWMRGQVAPDTSMPRWAASLMALRRTVSAEPPQPIFDAIAEARASGTSLVGDVTNTFATYDALASSDVSAAIFRELLGFSALDPDALVAAAEARAAELTPASSLRVSIVPHAPYSVSPGLFEAIARHASAKPISVHLGESAEELQFLRDGTGAWRVLLESLGVWNPSWKAPGCGPVEYLSRFGLVNPRLIAVHGVRFEDDDLAQLAAAGATVVTCPRSNRWTGAGDPPLERFYASGVRVAVGTDSLASVADLNVFAELALMRDLAPSVPARRLLASATIEGATALGFSGDLGSIAPGKRADLIAVRVPSDIADVEEYLVSGIQPGDVRWVRS